MVKAKADEIKKELKEEEKRFYGKEPSEEVKNVDETFKEIVGHEPHKGDTLAHEVEEAEKARRGIEPHEEEE